MDAVALFRQQFAQAHGWLDATLGETSHEQLHWLGPESIQPLSAQYAHAILSEDLILNMVIRRVDPLAMSSWAGQLGVSEPPPMGDWSAWSRTVQVDLGQLRTYAQAVYEQTDTYLASLTPEDLDREFDSSPLPFGVTTVATVLNILHGHVFMHAGEISTIKGLQGMQGYPL